MKRRRRRKKPSVREVRDCKNCLYYNRKFKICMMGLNHCILNRDAVTEILIRVKQRRIKPILSIRWIRLMRYGRFLISAADLRR